MRQRRKMKTKCIQALDLTVSIIVVIMVVMEFSVCDL